VEFSEKSQEFRAPFTTAEGWGMFSQRRADQVQTASVGVIWGRLKLKRLRLGLKENFRPAQIAVKLAGNPVSNVSSRVSAQELTIDIEFPEELVLTTGNDLAVELR
jgi:hypothetical protein